ncbi:unnamed protein product [Heterobilharzia americana]|nr:unnamed protein product [Heterobilharzia americana]
MKRVNVGKPPKVFENETHTITEDGWDVITEMKTEEIIVPHSYKVTKGTPKGNSILSFCISPISSP